MKVKLPDCGCTVVLTPPINEWVYITDERVTLEIKYCPLHARAEEMKDMLENIFESINCLPTKEAMEAISKLNMSKLLAAT